MPCDNLSGDVVSVWRFVCDILSCDVVSCDILSYNPLYTLFYKVSRIGFCSISFLKLSSLKVEKSLEDFICLTEIYKYNRILDTQLANFSINVDDMVYNIDCSKCFSSRVQDPQNLGTKGSL